MASYPDSTYDCDHYKVPTQYKTLYWDQSQPICSETIPRYPQSAVTLPLVGCRLCCSISPGNLGLYDGQLGKNSNKRFFATMHFYEVPITTY